MIAFGTAIVDAEAYRRYARPGILRAAEPDSAVLAYTSVGRAGRALNLVRERAAALPSLEALVLVGEGTEIAGDGLCAAVREALAEPDVGAVGCVGASGVTSLAWWEGRVSAAPIVHRYDEHGGHDLRGFAWTDPAPPPADVDALDGMLLVLSAWAVRNVAFDEELDRHFGADVDYCLRLREAGRRVRTAPLSVVRHAPLKLVDDLDLWTDAHVRFAGKWDGRLPGTAPTPDAEWRRRARRAEAERDAARTVAYSNASSLDARVAELEEALADVTGSLSWRATEPLRRVNRRRARRRHATA